MAKVTSKLQVTIPKRIADAYAIAPGDDIEFVEAGAGIRIVLSGQRARTELSAAERLRLFDATTERQRRRDRARSAANRGQGTGQGTGQGPVKGDRGWTREELYVRDKPR
jgi:AbrB family looped-hinge helix DNA binding protein